MASHEPALAAPYTEPTADAVVTRGQEAYARLDARGYHYGPAFQGLRTVHQDGKTLHAEISLDGDRTDQEAFALHPALLDAALHPLALAAAADDGDSLVVPYSWRGVRLHASGATSARVRLTRAPARVRTHSV
nr:polyketide synthase dehydratase domain-containing protein [Streptomyces sp. RKAG290]